MNCRLHGSVVAVAGRESPVYSRKGNCSPQASLTDMLALMTTANPMQMASLRSLLTGEPAVNDTGPCAVLSGSEMRASCIMLVC